MDNISPQALRAPLNLHESIQLLAVMSPLEERVSQIFATAREGFAAFLDTCGEFREKMEVTLATVNHDGRALESMSEELKGNRDLVLIAVLQNAKAF